MANDPFRTPAFKKPSRPVPKYVQTSTLKESGLLTTPIKRPSSDQVHSRTRLKLDPPLSTDISETPKMPIRFEKGGLCPKRKRENSRGRKRITRQTPTTFTHSNDKEKSSELVPKVVTQLTKGSNQPSSQENEATTIAITKDKEKLLKKGRAISNSDLMAESTTQRNQTMPIQSDLRQLQSVKPNITTVQNRWTNYNSTVMIQNNHRLPQDLEDTTVTSTPLPIAVKKVKKEQKERVQTSEKKEQTKGQYICDECGRTLTSHQCVDRHIGGKHLKLKNFICEHCGEGFGYFVNLKYHRLQVHRDEDREVVCDSCDKLFNPFVVIFHIQHLRNCGRQKFYCNECGESRKKSSDSQKNTVPTYHNQTQLLRHKQIAHGPKKCQKCDITSENLFEHLKHLKKYHDLSVDGQPAKARTLICDGCEETISARPVKDREKIGRFRRHTIRCNVAEAFDCSKCKASFRKREDRDQHWIEKHPNWYGRYICDICSVSMYSVLHFARHMERTHTNDSKWTKTLVICDICNGVQDRPEIARHLNRVHFKQGKKFACDNCEERFLRQQPFENHKRNKHGIVGIGTKTFDCETCTGYFYTKNSLTRHICLFNSCNKVSVRCLINTIPKTEKSELVFSDYQEQLCHLAET